LQRWRIWDSLVDGFLVLLKSKEVRELECRLKKSFIQDSQIAREGKETKSNCFGYFSIGLLFFISFFSNLAQSSRTKFVLKPQARGEDRRWKCSIFSLCYLLNNFVPIFVIFI
jgi:hypothetical protein